MNIEIAAKQKKSKLVGIRLTEIEYDIISKIAEKKKASRSYIAEILVRAALTNYDIGDASKAETK